MAYAIIEISGRQYRVEQGESIVVDRLDAKQGAKLTPRALLFADGSKSVEGADAIAQDANAVAIQATNYRATGARAEPGGGDSGLLVQGFTEAAVLLLQQVVAFEHGAGGGQLAVTQRVGGDDLGFELHRLAGWCGKPERDGEGREAKRCVQHGDGAFLGRCFFIVTI